jgi:hypothetical protein
MPFSSLKDPADLARAATVMETAWAELEAAIPEEKRDAERMRLAYIVAYWAPLALDEDDLRQSVLLQFKGPSSFWGGLSEVR